MRKHVAAKMNLGIEVTVISIQNSRSHELPEYILRDLFQQIPKPLILTGDFSSYYENGINKSNDKRGKEIFRFTQKHLLKLINDGRHTRRNGVSKSAFDLTIKYPSPKSFCRELFQKALSITV